MNSQIELDESVTLVRKLIDRTRERKIAWSECVAIQSKEVSSFCTTLDLTQEAVIGRREGGFLEFSLVEHDPRWSDRSLWTAKSGFDPPLIEDKTVLQVSIEKEPSFGFDTQQEFVLSTLLVNLYELARRSAFQIDSSVGKALTYLDKLAV
jgi:hypothetical protein